MVTAEQYEAKYREQRGACAICEVVNLDGQPFMPDAGPRCDVIRALLCGNCSTLVRVCYEDPEHFLAIAKYVMRQMKERH